MRNKAIEYPHPVLNEYTNDFQDSEFSIEVVNHNDNGNSLTIEIGCSLKCEGIKRMITAEIAKIVLRLTCFRTSYRVTYDLNLDSTSIIESKTGFYYLNAIIKAKSQNVVKE